MRSGSAAAVRSFFTGSILPRMQRGERPSEAQLDEAFGKHIGWLGRRCTAELRGFAAEFDSVVFDTFRQVYGLEPAELTELPVAQIHRPQARGGFGVRRLAARLDFNFVDGALGAASFIARGLGQPLLDSDAPYERAIKAAEQKLLAEWNHGREELRAAYELEIAGLQAETEAYVKGAKAQAEAAYNAAVAEGKLALDLAGTIGEEPNIFRVRAPRNPAQ